MLCYWEYEIFLKSGEYSGAFIDFYLFSFLQAIYLKRELKVTNSFIKPSDKSSRVIVCIPPVIFSIQKYKCVNVANLQAEPI